MLAQQKKKNFLRGGGGGGHNPLQSTHDIYVSDTMNVPEPVPQCPLPARC